MEELDFRREAQFQHAFRRNAKRRSRRDFFTAPRVHFDLSTDQVLVQEFVAGMWLWEVIATVEQNDPEGLAMMQEMNIDPALVGRRILWTAFWSIEENLFFHADPHPANILVGPDSTLTFIDFGSCGSFNDEQRWAAERIGTSMQRDDAEGMARATFKLLEPLPPVDLTELMKEAQAEYVRVLYTFRTRARHTEWWERTSARLWLAMVRIARRHNMPIGLGTLRMIRATLLYDTIVLRLDKSINRYDEYERFRSDRASFARDRWRQRLRSARERVLLYADEWRDTGDELLERAQHVLSMPGAGFSSLIEKSVFSFATLGRVLARIGALTVVAMAAVGVDAYAASGTVQVLGALRTVVESPYYVFAVAGIVVLGLRQVLFRLREYEVQPRRDRLL
jgi:predicted unusual protein kinase regulating ubiquinone biosynthesis (AarF/ABC1/UbiB family)